MKKLKMTEIDKIKDLIESPAVTFKLQPSMKKFLVDYARNRKNYENKPFLTDESEIIRDILDEIFYDYITQMERCQMEIEEMDEGVKNLKMEQAAKVKDLHELGNKFAFERTTDSDDPSRWNLFIDRDDPKIQEQLEHV